MARKRKFTYPERIAARIAGKMIITVRRHVLNEGISGLYWRGFQAGVRTSIASLAEGHKTARQVKRWERLTRLLERLESRKARP